MGEEHVVGVQHDRADGSPRVTSELLLGRYRDPTQDVVEHQVEEVVLARDVAVEGVGRHAEAARDGAQAQCLDAVLAQHGPGGGEHLIGVETGALARPSGG